jgi:hypothetical protein
MFPSGGLNLTPSEGRFQLIDDTDLAGTIPYLPKG